MVLFSHIVLFNITSFLHSSSYTTTRNLNKTFIPTLYIHHLPSKLGCFYNCIYIYEWFFNQHSSFVLHHNTTRPSIHSVSYRRSSKRLYQLLSKHHILFSIYLLSIMTLTYGVHTDTLPISVLSIPPFFIFSSLLVNHIQPSLPKVCSSRVLPSRTSLSTDLEKRCYLSAWQSTCSSNPRILHFSSDKALCIDTGASCCISNDRSDFMDYNVITSSVLHGISSGLQIAGTGTL